MDSAPFNVQYFPFFIDLEFCNQLSGAILLALYH